MNLKVIICLCFISLTGVLGKEDRIFGGTVVAVAEFPYVASIKLFQGNLMICSATVISKWNLLTAATCMTPHENDLDILRVSVGRSSAQAHGTFRILESNNHPFFDMTNPFSNNLCVIKLRIAIQFNAYQNKIPLAITPPRSGDLAYIAGWGLYDSQMGPLTAGRLRKAAVYTLNYSDCRAVIPYPILQNHFCTYQRHGIGVCPGDIGGPVIVNGQLHGIIAYSCHHCGNNTPDIHLSIYHHLHFILLLMEE